MRALVWLFAWQSMAAFAASPSNEITYLVCEKDNGEMIAVVAGSTTRYQDLLRHMSVAKLEFLGLHPMTMVRDLRWNEIEELRARDGFLSLRNCYQEDERSLLIFDNPPPRWGLNDRPLLLLIGGERLYRLQGELGPDEVRPLRTIGAEGRHGLDEVVRGTLAKSLASLRGTSTRQTVERIFRVLKDEGLLACESEAGEWVERCQATESGLRTWTAMQILQRGIRDW